jgi:hypothetical protein
MNIAAIDAACEAFDPQGWHDASPEYRNKMRCRMRKALDAATPYTAAPELIEALKQIANGEGYYGAQAREYKEIARAALAKATEVKS